MKDLAGDITLGTMTQTQVYMGEAPIVTNHYQAADGVGFAQYELFAVDANGKAIKWVPGATDNTGIVAGIAGQPWPAATPGNYGPAWEAGIFNHAALVWPASLASATFAARRAAVGVNRSIKLGEVY